MKLLSLSECLLYGILDLGYISPKDCYPIAKLMQQGGVDMIQLRAKGYPTSEIKVVVRSLVPLFKSIPFILNDYPQLVAETGVIGCHIGQADLPLLQAKSIVGKHAMVGCSTHNLRQALSASIHGADYISFGPLFATPTKPQYPPIGLENIKKVHQLVSLPIFCIGGIKRENLPTVLAAGAQRVSIVSGILQATDIKSFCQECKAILSARRSY